MRIYRAKDRSEESVSFASEHILNMGEFYMNKGLSGSTLKIIAMVTMLIDHIGAAVLARMIIAGNADLYDAYRTLRMIGRIAFPIFCFLLIEGFQHTKNAKKYAERLFLFAAISEIPFDLAFSAKVLEFQYQNVFFTLAIGLVTIMAYKKVEESPISNSVLKLILQLAVGLAGGCIAEVLGTDYGMLGVMVLVVFYMLRANRFYQIAAGCMLFIDNITALLAFIPVAFYDGRRGLNVKWLFYVFYPAHLLVLYGICYMMGLAHISVV